MFHLKLEWLCRLPLWSSLAASVQQDVVLLLMMMLRDTRGYLGFPLCHSSYLSLRCLFRHMPTVQWILHRWVLFQSWTLHWFVCMLVSAMVCVFYFQIPMWMSCSAIGTQWLGYAPLQPFGAYLLQPYMHPGDDLRPMPGMHKVAGPFTASRRGILILLSQVSSSHSSNMVLHTAWERGQRVS